MVNQGADKQWTLFFDKVELEEERLIGGYNGGLARSSTASTRSGSWARRSPWDSAATRSTRRPSTRASARCGRRRSAPTRASRIPLAEAKIELELARLMAQKAAALYDAGAKGAGEASNMAKYAAAEAGIKCVDQAIQTHGGNGFALEYGVAQLWWGVRIARTAPVSREMILNYVAEHSLGLPKSY